MEPAKENFYSSLEGVAPQVQVVESIAPPTKVLGRSFSPFHFNRAAFLITAVSIAAIGTIGIIGFALTSTKSVNDNVGGNGNNYAISKISVSEAKESDQLQIEKADHLEINGQLQVNNGIIVKPSSSPIKPVAGQIYYDDTTNQLYYYNGTVFVSTAPQEIPKSVVSIGGATGVVALGEGLQITNNRLSLTANALQGANGPRVTSFQGQTGDINLIAGAGVIINGTTISSSGVLNIGGVTGSIALGTGLGIVNNTINNTGVTVLNGTANQVNVSTSTGNVTLSLPQNIGVTSAPTFGGLTVSGNIGTNGTITYSTNGTADTSSFVCRNSSNQLAACNSSGAGAAFVQGGNSFGATGILGTNDANDLQLVTGGATKLTILNSNGNVGIGTALPSNKLSVVGAANFTGHLAIGNGATIDQNRNEYNDILQPNSRAVENIREVYTDLTGYDLAGSDVDVTFNPASSPTVTFMTGQRSVARTAAGNTQNFGGNLVGTWNMAIHSGTGTVPQSFGAVDFVFNNSSGTIGSTYGTWGGSFNRSTGTIGTAYGGYFSVNNSSTGTITNGYGVNILSAVNGGGTYTNNYGLYVQDQSGVGSANSYNIYSAGATSKNYFDGNVTVNGTTGLTGALTANASTFNGNVSISGNNTLTVGTGATTLGGTLAYASNGATDTSSYVCRNTSNQLAACNTTGTGTAFVQGGNSFGTAALLGTNDNQALVLRTAGVERLRVTETGNVGIGTDTPISKLYVKNDSSITSGSSFGFIIGGQQTAANPTGFYYGSYIAPNYNSSGSLGALVANAVVPTNSGSGTVDLAYGTLVQSVNAGTSTTTTNIGIGVANPVKGASAIITNNFGLYIQDQTAGASNYALYSEGGTIYSGGNLGIGTASPQDKLNIATGGSGTVGLQVGLQTDSFWSALHGNDLTFNRSNPSYVSQENAAGSLRLGVQASLNLYPALSFYNDRARINTNNANNLGLLIVGATSQTADVLRVDTSTGTTQFVVQGTGNVGIGTAAPGNKLSVAGSANFSGHLAVGGSATVDQNYVAYDNSSHTSLTVHNIRETFTDTVKEYNVGNQVDVTFNPGATANNVMFGSQSTARTAVGNTQNFTGGGLAASNNLAIHNGSGSITQVIGAVDWAFNNAGGAVAKAVGTYGLTVNLGVGTITDAYGGLFQVGNAAGNITNGYGIQVAASGNSGTFTNNYGLYIQDQSGVGSANSYNIYSAGAASKNYFAGSVGIGTATIPTNKLTVNTLTTSNAATNLAQLSVSSGAVGNVGQIIQGVAGQTGDLFQTQNSSGTVLAKIDASGNLTAGNAVLNGTYTQTKDFGPVTSGTGVFGNYTSVNSSADASGTGGAYGAFNYFNLNGSNNFNAGQTNQYLYTNNSSTGTTGQLFGVTSLAANSSTGTVTNAYGFAPRLAVFGSGNVTNFFGVRAFTPIISSTGIATNVYGLYVAPQKVTGVTNGYGLYQEGVTDLNVLFGATSINNTLTLTTLGSADTATSVCRNAANQLATCNTTGTGAAFLQGGNSFGVAADLGTNDNFGLNLRTNGTTKLTVTTAGDLVFAQGANRTISVGQNSSNATGFALALTAGTGGAGNNNGGDLTLNGGAATGTGTIGNVLLQAAGGNVAVGTSTFSASVFNANNKGLVVSNSTGSSNLALESFRNTGNHSKLVSIAARGTALSPLALGSADAILEINANPFNGTDSNSPSARIILGADGTQTTGSIPSYISFYTTPSGSSSALDRVHIDNAGNVGINTTTPTEKLTVTNGNGLFEYGNLKFSTVNAPAAPTVAVNATAGNLTGPLYYVISFVTATGETSYGTVSASVNPIAQQVNISAIQTGSVGGVTQRKIFRGTTATGPFKLVTTLADNSTATYTDNIAAGSLGADAKNRNTTGGQLAVNSNPVFYVSNAPDNNAFVGLQSGLNNTTGDNNAAFGNGTLVFNTTGSLNAALGVNALRANTSGTYNVGVGPAALFSNTTGIQNTAIGGNSLLYNLSGNYNVANGTGALAFNVSGSNNTGNGYVSLYQTTGSNNTGFGSGSLFANISGSNNTAIGYNAGNQDSGTFFNTSSGLQNSTAIGTSAQVQASNSIVLGSVDTATKVGIGTTIPLNTFSVSPVNLNSATVNASQSLNTVTAASAIFTAANVGEQLIFADGTSGGLITGFTSTTVVTVSTSQTVASQKFRTHRIGLQTDSSGNVGIGTSAPTARLQTQGAAAVAGTGTISSSGLTVTGVGTSFTTQLAIGDLISAGGQNRTVATITNDTSLTTNSSFNPGLAGGTSFTFNKPIANFTDASGTSALFVQGGSGAVGIGTLLPNSNTGLTVANRAAISGNTAGQEALIVDQKAASGDILSLRQGGASKVVVDYNGNVGFGTTPSSNLHIKSPSTSPVLQILESTGVTSRGYVFGGNNNVGLALNSHPLTGALDNSSVASWHMGFFNFGSDNFQIGRAPAGTSTVTDVFRINSSGNVGINNSSPTQGNLAINQIANGNSLFYGKRFTDSSPTGNFFQFQNASSVDIATLDVAGNLTVKSATFNGNITVNGHIVSGNTSGTTTVAAGAAACTTPTVTISGNDTAGTVTITTGTGCAAAGLLATITFAQTYGAAPRVTLTPANANASAIQWYTNSSTTTTFTVDTNTTPADSTTYKYNYQIMQ